MEPHWESPMGDLEKCEECGEPLSFAVPLSDKAVLRELCQKCHPKGVEVLYVPNDIPASDQNQSDCDKNDRETLTKRNIKKIESRDKIEFKDDDGSLRILNVTSHAKPDMNVKGIYEKDGEFKRVAFNYTETFDKNGQILFEFPELREDWDNRVDVPFDYPSSDSDNEKNMLEACKRGYLEDIKFVSTKMEIVSNLITQAALFGVGCLAKATVFLGDVIDSPWKTFFYVAWKHGALKVKLKNGDITERQYEAECNEYHKYFGKAAVLSGCVAGGVASLGVRALLMEFHQMVTEQLTNEWKEMGLSQGKIVITIEETITFIEAKSATEALQWLCTMFPKLESLVSFVGGPQKFLTIGAISFIVTGGLLGYYICSKFINKNAIKQLSADVLAAKKEN